MRILGEYEEQLSDWLRAISDTLSWYHSAHIGSVCVYSRGQRSASHTALLPPPFVCASSGVKLTHLSGPQLSLPLLQEEEEEEGGEEEEEEEEDTL